MVNKIKVSEWIQYFYRTTVFLNNSNRTEI